jgi:DnaJ domain
MYASVSSGGGEAPFPFPEHRNPTPYEIFHLPPTCTQSEIKARFYELVRYHHPDSSPTPQDHFKAILAAYGTLRNPISRSTLARRSGGNSFGEDRYARHNPWYTSTGTWPHERRGHPSMAYDFGWSSETGAKFYTPNPAEAEARDLRKKRMIQTLAGFSLILYTMTYFVLHPTGSLGEPWGTQMLGGSGIYQRHDMASKSLEEARASAKVWTSRRKEEARREARRINVEKTCTGSVQTGH